MLCGMTVPLTRLFSVSDLQNACKHMADDHPCCAGSLNLIAERFAALAELLWEVRSAHCDKDSSDYNGCDTDPCHWCELYLAAVDGTPNAEHQTRCQASPECSCCAEIGGDDGRA